MDPYFQDPNPLNFIILAFHFIDFFRVLEFSILHLLAFLNLKHHILTLLNNVGICYLIISTLILQLAYSLNLIDYIPRINVIVLWNYLLVFHFKYDQISFFLIFVIPIIVPFIIFQFIKFHLLFTS